MPQSVQQLLKNIDMNQLLNHKQYCQTHLLTPLESLLNQAGNDVQIQKLLHLIQEYQLFNALNQLHFVRLDISNCFRIAFHNQANAQWLMPISSQQNQLISQNEKKFQTNLYDIAYQTFHQLPTGIQLHIDQTFDILANLDFQIAILPLSPKISQSGISVDFMELHHQLANHFQKNEFNLFKYPLNPGLKKQIRHYIENHPDVEFVEWLKLWKEWEFMLTHCQHLTVQWYQDHQLKPLDDNLNQILVARKLLSHSQSKNLRK